VFNPNPGRLRLAQHPASPLTFEEIFTRHLLVIKEYQRGYSWQRDNLEHFINDLDTIIQNYDYDPALNPQGTKEHHNFGTIQTKEKYKVNDPQFGQDHSIPVLAVADGQQRLITTMIFLRALADRINEHGNNIPLNQFTNFFERPYHRIDPQGNLRPASQYPLIKLNHTEFHSCLRNIVINGTHAPDNTGPVKRMKYALKYFKDHLSVKDLQECENYKVTLLERCELVLLRNKWSNEFMVFEARNFRGRPVSELDKVKNLIELIQYRGHLTGPAIDFPSKWFEATKKLDQAGLGSRTDEDRILSYSMSIGVWAKHIGPKECYSEFRKRFWKLTNEPPHGGFQTLEDELRNFIQAFEKVVDAYVELRKPVPDFPRFTGGKRGSESDARKAIFDIRRTGREVIFEPLLIATYLKIPQREREHFAVVAANVEKALFRVYVMKGNRKTNWRQTPIARAASDIYNERHRDIGNAIIENYPLREGFNGCLPDGSMTRGMKRNHPRLLPHECAIDFLCSLVITSDHANQSLSQLLKKLKQEDDAYKTSTNWGQYFLYQYECSLSPALSLVPSSNFTVNGDDIADYTVEHIMPRKPRDEIHIQPPNKLQNYWLRVPPQRFLSEQERSSYYLNLLGNLVMSKQQNNSDYWCHPYTQSQLENPLATVGQMARPVRGKRDMYLSRNGDWHAVSEVARYYNDWNKRTIKHRQACLAIWAVKRWKMDCSCDIDPLPEELLLPETHTGELSDDFIDLHSEKPWFGEILDAEEVEQLIENDLQNSQIEEIRESLLDGDNAQINGNLLISETQYDSEEKVRFWIEKTNLEGRDDRINGERKLGSAIWSPLYAKTKKKGQKGQDIYRFMRDVSKGDIIIHVVDKGEKARITGVSIVKSPEILYVKGLPNSPWDEKTDCHMHMLEENIELAEPLLIYDHLLTEQNKPELDQIREDQEASFYTKKDKLREGGYLTPCSSALVSLINRVCMEVNNNPLPHQFGQTTEILLDLESAKNEYGGNDNFGPSYPKDQFVFGSNRPGKNCKHTDYSQEAVDSWTNVMKAHGIKRVACLLHPDKYLSSYDHLEGGLEGQYESKFGAENVLMVPINDYDIATEDQIIRLTNFFAESERLKLPVVVHCSAGSGRTGHVLSVWRKNRWNLERNESLSQRGFEPASRFPKESVGEPSKHLGKHIETEDIYRLMEIVESQEESTEE